MPSEQPRIGIILVHFNGTEDLACCLQSLKSLRYSSFFVVVVDNASDAEQARRARKLTLESSQSFATHFISSPENRGFAGGNNLGIKLAITLEAEALWLLNTDTVVDTESLAELVEAYERLPRAILGSKVLYGPSEPQAALEAASARGARKAGKIWSAGAGIDFQRQETEMFGWNEADDGRFDTERECDYIPGCSLLAPSGLVSEVGDLPEEFFLYFEETEWCVRMKSRGVALRYIPRSVVWHRFDDSKMQSARTVYYYNRNRLNFWFRHSNSAGKRKLWWRVLGKDLPGALKACYRAPDQSQRMVFRSHCLAYKDFLLGRMGKRETF